MAFTLTDVKQFLRDYDFDNSGSRGDRIYLKIANDALRDLYEAGEFDFSTRKTRVSLAATYTTGTVSVSAAGTTVTGSGTTFTSAMVGRHIRFYNQPQTYLITAFGSTTSLTIETGGYLGSSALSGVTYAITDERKAMPSNCRGINRLRVDEIANGGGLVSWLEPVSLAQLEEMRAVNSGAYFPTWFATETYSPSSGNVPASYYWIYPPSDVARTATVFYSLWPAELSTGSDECPIPREAEAAYREFLLARVFKEQRNFDAYQSQLVVARQVAARACGSMRLNDQSRCMSEWNPDVDNGYRRPVYWPKVDPSIPTSGY